MAAASTPASRRWTPDATIAGRFPSAEPATSTSRRATSGSGRVRFASRRRPEWDALVSRIKDGERIIIDILYGDHDGGQRTISRFSLQPRRDGEWLATVARHLES